MSPPGGLPQVRSSTVDTMSSREGCRAHQKGHTEANTRCGSWPKVRLQNGGILGRDPCYNLNNNMGTRVKAICGKSSCILALCSPCRQP